MPIRLAGVALALTLMSVVAPAAGACITMDDHTFTLRPAAPPTVEPGEVVLEIDRKSMVGGVLGRYIRFNVKRVVSGNYAEPSVLVSYLPTSCSYLAYGETDSYVVGRLDQRRDGPLVLAARTWRLGGDPRAKAAN